MLIAAAFHYVRPSFEQPHPAIFGVTPEAFRGQLAALARHASFVSQENLLAAARGDRKLPDRAWLITFDDGLREQYDYAWPVLREMGIPAIFFANTAPIANRKVALVHKIHLLRSQVASKDLLAHVEAAAAAQAIEIVPADRMQAMRHYIYDSHDAATLKYLLNFGLSEQARTTVIDHCFGELLGWGEEEISDALYMTPAQLRELAESGCLGSHTHNHYSLGQLDSAKIQHEIFESLRLIREWTGTGARTMSYPYGSREACSAEAGRIAAGCGIELAFTMERAGLADFRQQLFLPRCANNDLPGGAAPRWSGGRIFQEMSVSCWHR